MHKYWTPLLRRCSSSLASRPPLSVPYKTGQPMHETRSHMIPQPGHLTPGISALEYYNRRLTLAKEMPPKSAAILVGNQVQHSSGSVFYEFQQDNDLYYLTGWLDPDSVVVVEKVSDHGTDEDVVLHMFVPPKNAATDLWEGDKNGLEAAYDYFNADEVHDVNKVAAGLQEIVRRNEHIYYDKKGGSGGGSGSASKFSSFFSVGPSARTSSIASVLEAAKKNVRPLKGVLAQHRKLKSEAEIRVMLRAGQISGKAINTAIAAVGSEAPFATEKTLAKYLEYAFVRGGCDRNAYIPVVASGENALTLHYTRNDDLLYEDETVFVDAGGKLGGYCADISRAWPNSAAGFSGPQKDIYNVVLAANKTCIEQCHEASGLSLQGLHELAVTTLTQGLRELPGMGHVTRAQVTRDLFPHYIGHHLGLDLHDVPSVSRSAPLVQGNVVTVEPGVYIPKNDTWPRHFQGIGVRVEDDIAVGASSSATRNLTSSCVKEIEDIEALIRSGRVTTPQAYDEAVVVDI